MAKTYVRQFRTRDGRIVRIKTDKPYHGKDWNKPVGFCKLVHNPRTGVTLRLCKTGRGRTGWAFQKQGSKKGRRR